MKKFSIILTAFVLVLLCAIMLPTEIHADGMCAAGEHQEVAISGVDPTYSSAGSTAGKHCSVCGEVLESSMYIAELDENVKFHYDVTKESVAAGDAFTVNIYFDVLADVDDIYESDVLANIYAVDIGFNFDKNAFEFVGAEIPSGLFMMSQYTPVETANEQGFVMIVQDGLWGSKTFRGENIFFASMTFQVREDATAGKYTFENYYLDVVHPDLDEVIDFSTSDKGVSVIVEEEETGPILDENLTIPNKALLLGGYIGAQFVVNPEATADYDYVYIIVNFNGEEFKYDVSLAPDACAYEHRVAPKFMNVAMQITAYATKDGKTYYGNTETWSVKDGIVSRLDTFFPYKDRSEVYMNRCILLVDMLNYGAQAQIKFGTDADGLVTDGVRADYMALATKTAPAISAAVTATTTAKDNLYQYNLGLEDAVQMQFTFRLASTDYSQYTVKITHNGTTYEYGAESFMPTGNASFVGVIFDKLEAVNMRDTVTIELWRNGAKVSATYEASIEGVAKLNIDKGANVELLKAMMTYGDSAVTSLT